jgi:hypothetical protein
MGTSLWTVQSEEDYREEQEGQEGGTSASGIGEPYESARLRPLPEVLSGTESQVVSTPAGVSEGRKESGWVQCTCRSSNQCLLWSS